jgi:allantoinase
MDQVFRSHKVVTPEGVAPRSVHVRDGTICAVLPYDAPTHLPVVELGDAALLPGVVDTHVHVNEPGRTEWEGFHSATRAAAAGGVTTLVDMPLNSIPPTTSVEALRRKREAARGQCAVDVGFWGGVVPGNQDALAPMTEGVLGFKCFLCDSGVDEFPGVTEAGLRPSMAILAKLGVPLLVHAELPGPLAAAAKTDTDPRLYQSYLQSRPRAAEDQAVELMIRLCRETRARVHIVHHSSSNALPLLRQARDAGLPLSAETCPHYLTFAAEDIPDGATHFKCAPPIRERENRELLWEALAQGVLDFVASDHSPCTPALKHPESGDFLGAWGGVAGLQLSLPVLWTEASARGFGLTHVVGWLCAGPARLAGLVGKKGAIAVGYDADLVVFRPDESFHVDAALLRHRHKLTPYLGRELVGVVESTFVRGHKVYDQGELVGPARGQLLGGKAT